MMRETTAEPKCMTREPLVPWSNAVFGLGSTFPLVMRRLKAPQCHHTVIGWLPGPSASLNWCLWSRGVEPGKPVLAGRNGEGAGRISGA